jgi:predicted DNA-binding antitoxin AbrB/MazE fold protein
MVIRAIFKNGVAVPETSVDVPDGTEVGIILPGPNSGTVAELTPEFREEFKFWEDLSADAWEKFLEWERETPA